MTLFILIAVVMIPVIILTGIGAYMSTKGGGDDNAADTDAVDDCVVEKREEEKHTGKR